MKITKKVNFDSMYVMATSPVDKTYFKVSITRGGIKTKSTLVSELRDKYSNAFKTEFVKYQNEKLTYGEFLNNTENAFNKIN